MNYQQALNRQKFDGCTVKKAIRKSDHYLIITKDGTEFQFDLEFGARHFPLAIVDTK